MTRVHTNTVQDAETGVWFIELLINDAPCGVLGPVAIEDTADILAEGLREGMRIALERAQARR
jgi:hypothetical protein